MNILYLSMSFLTIEKPFDIHMVTFLIIVWIGLSSCIYTLCVLCTCTYVSMYVCRYNEIYACWQDR